MAVRYLLPRKGHLSQSIISLLSVVVISLIVWLVLIFLSVTEGLEKGWINKITAVSAPLRLTPKEAYFDSYYYQVDAFSSTSDYRLKSIKEKLASTNLDPYDEDLDGSLPSYLPLSEKRDLIKETFIILEKYGQPAPFEIASSELHIHLVRDKGENFLNQLSYLTALEENSSSFASIVQKVDVADCKNWEAIAKRDAHPNSILAHLDSEENHFTKEPVAPPRLWAYTVNNQTFLPRDPLGREPLLLAKGFRDNGLCMGDHVNIAFYGSTFSGPQEMVKKGYVAGFYDPGIMPLGGRLVMARPALVTEIRAASQSERWPQGSGIFVYINDPLQAPYVKELILTKLKESALDSYWTVESYEDYDFSKDLVQQLKSDKYLFTLIAFIIILVACSNILSMLILLVNDKKKDIGVLQSMGATKKSIALIFGLVGTALGLLASILGTIVAYFTLANIQTLVDILALLQGRNPFNTLFFGDKLPSTMSSNALIIVWIATSLLSIIAGLVPAIKASRLKPTETLKG